MTLPTLLTPKNIKPISIFLSDIIAHTGRFIANKNGKYEKKSTNLNIINKTIYRETILQFREIKLRYYPLKTESPAVRGRFLSYQFRHIKWSGQHLPRQPLCPTGQ